MTTPTTSKRIDGLTDAKGFDRDATTVQFEAVRAEDGDGNDIYELAFSSETPVMRYFGEELLDHAPGSMRLDRLNNGAPVLVNHDRDDQVGVVIKGSGRIDSDRKGRAKIRFSRSERGKEIRQDVDDEIRQLVSFHYRIHDYTVTEREGMPDLVRITDWEPTEITIATVPADPSIGFGRTDEPNHTAQRETVMTTETKTPGTEETRTEETRTAPAAAPLDREKELNKIRTQEAQRVAAIDEIADTYDLQELGAQARSEGWTVDVMNSKALEEIGKRNNAARAESEAEGEVDLTDKERQRFSLVRVLDYLRDPSNARLQENAAFELEVGRAAADEFGDQFKARGEFIPQSLLEGDRALSAGGATAGAELVGTDLLAASFIEVLRNSSAALQAGVTYLPGLVGNVDIPRQTSGATSTWISAEDGDATESEPTFDQISLSPKDLACYTEFTRRLTQQSTPAIEGLVRADLAMAQALGIDKAVLYGTGTSGQPTGLINQTGLNEKDFAAAAPTYEELVDMITLVMQGNALAGSFNWLINAQGWNDLSTTPRQAAGVEGNFILGDNERVKGYPYIQSEQVEPKDFWFGNFAQVLMGEWGGLELNVDPYTHSLKGRIRYVTFKTVDIAVRHATAFCRGSEDVTP